MQGSTRVLKMTGQTLNSLAGGHFLSKTSRSILVPPTHLYIGLFRPIHIVVTSQGYDDVCRRKHASSAF